MSARQLRRAAWLSDYFPRPHDMTTGTWALEAAAALQKAGLPTIAIAPTPWIPGPLAFNQELRNWARVPSRHAVRGVEIFYPRCPHYPKRWINNVLYNKVPFLDTRVVWPWFARAVAQVMQSHPFEVVHANFMFPCGYLGMRLKERHGVGLVTHERSVQRLAYAKANPARRELYRRILRASDLVLTENDAMAAELRELEPATRDVRVLQQPGCDPTLTEASRAPRPAQYAGKKVILSVGTLSERKGHACLVKAMAQLRQVEPDAVCRIIGDGPERGALTELVRSLGLEHTVELLGKRPHAEVLAAMSWCDVFSLASWGEASGTVYGEVMQFDKPVIACEGEGIADIVRDGVHGRLVPARDEHRLAEALQWLLADAGRLGQLGRQARALCEDRLSYPTLARTLSGLYSDIVAGIPLRK